MVSKVSSLHFVRALICLLAALANGYADPRVSAFRTTLHQPQNAAVQFAAFADSANATIAYRWNLDDRQAPLLGFAAERIAESFEERLTYSAEGFHFLVFRTLNFDEREGKYLLPTISKESGGVHFIEFAPAGSPNKYATDADTGMQLIDQDNLKTVVTVNGTKYLFVQYPDGEFRCAMIKPKNGVVVNFLYAANGLTLHGIVDSTGRTVTFNYGKSGIVSITQSWMGQSEGFTRSWFVGDQIEPDTSIRYSHSVVANLKSIPANATIREYTSEMAASDRLLAEIFGGPGAVAGANGFEPPGLGAQYPLYRGDFLGDDGKLRSGHLSHAMHLYGSADGRGDSPIYVPAGFTEHSKQPSPVDAAVLFYYPKLGNLTDVTLAVFHVADFQIIYEGDRVRIGKIGGPGGFSPLYKHSHIDFYRGNNSLPPAGTRAALRIDPATVFGKR
ncbi:MAG TPA: hypothetical protein VJT71_19620 [Pyrinomonadaceae bacterium]|nr:hypothetical protein [Pyrinomonadaceae bacterium]